MSLLKEISEVIFRGKKTESARESAKQRLHLVLINDRAGRDSPDFMPRLRQDIIEVLKKYVPIASEEDVEISIANKDDTSIMEMSVSLDRTSRIPDEEVKFRPPRGGY